MPNRTKPPSVFAKETMALTILYFALVVTFGPIGGVNFHSRYLFSDFAETNLEINSLLSDNGSSQLDNAANDGRRLRFNADTPTLNQGQSKGHLFVLFWQNRLLVVVPSAAPITRVLISALCRRLKVAIPYYTHLTSREQTLSATIRST